jgi:hypothetical protein
MLCAANRGATALLVAAGALALAFALDRWWILSTSARTTITSLVFAVTAVMLARALVPLLRPSRWASVAKAVERHDASFRGEILSSVEIGLEAASGRSRWSTHLLEALFEQASRKLRGLEPGALYPARRTLLFGAAALAAWVALLVLALSQPQSTRLLARRLVHPWTDLPRPTTTLLELAPGSAVVARGDDVELVVRALRGEPSSALLAVHVDDAPEVEESRTFEAAALVRRFSAVRRSFEYQVSAGDFASPVYRIEVREPPRPVRFRITYRLPCLHPPGSGRGRVGLGRSLGAAGDGRGLERERQRSSRVGTSRDLDPWQRNAPPARECRSMGPKRWHKGSSSTVRGPTAFSSRRPTAFRTGAARSSPCDRCPIAPR